MRRGWVAVLCLLASPVLSDGVINAPRPPIRPGTALVAAAPSAAAAQSPARYPAPPPRPEGAVQAVALAHPLADQNTMTPVTSLLAPRDSARPPERPARVARVAAEVLEARRRGQVCGDPDIQGEELPDIDGPGACGVIAPVRLKSVLGVTFSNHPTMTCETARALKTWIERGVVPAMGSRGGGVDRLILMGDYTCRNQIGSGQSRLSEHALGHAVDIGGIRFEDGSTLMVEGGWPDRDLKQIHRAACGIFGTVLGPEANEAHHNHLHLDVAQNRGGAYCR